MKTLVLPLKKKWFEMIKSGEKLEEYREINKYWSNRLIFKDVFYDFESISMEELTKSIMDCSDTEFFNDFSEVEFTCGYPRKDDTERRITFKNPSIRIGEGLEKWGAEKGKYYFIITWEGVAE